MSNVEEPASPAMYTVQPLLDRPLRQDPLVLVAAGLFLLALVRTIRQNVEFGAGLNPNRAADVFGDLVEVGVGATLLVLVLPACLRRALRGRFAARRQVRFEAALAAASRRPAPPLPYFSRRAERGSAWSDGGARRSQLPSARRRALRGAGRPIDAGSPVSGGATRPPELDVTLDSDVVPLGAALRLSWTAPGADHVLVAGVQGLHGPTGSIDIVLEGSGDIEVTAVNAAGRRTVRSGLVKVLPVPEISAVRVAAPPAVRLFADVQVGLPAGEPVLARLDRVLAGHRDLRTPDPAFAGSPVERALVGLGAVMSALSGWRPGRATSRDPLPVTPPATTYRVGRLRETARAAPSHTITRIKSAYQARRVAARKRSATAAEQRTAAVPVMPSAPRGFSGAPITPYAGSAYNAHGLSNGAATPFPARMNSPTSPGDPHQFSGGGALSQATSPRAPHAEVQT